MSPEEVVQKGIKGLHLRRPRCMASGRHAASQFMLNDRSRMLPANHPVIMELYNPLGQFYLRKTQTKGEAGLYVFDMPTEPDAPTGAWNVNVNVGGVTPLRSVSVSKRSNRTA